MTKKIVLITGANTGLGYQMVRGLCDSSQEYEILVGGRSLEKAQRAADDAKAEFSSTKSHPVAIQIDIESDESIQAAYKMVADKYGRLDALINNAGASFDQQYTAGELSMREAWNRSWAVNTTSTQIMTHIFAPLLVKSSDPRLIFVASGTSSLKVSENYNLPFNKVMNKGWPKQAPPAAMIPAYRSAKTGMNMMMREWTRHLKEDGVKVWCISPGFLATGLGGNQEALRKAGAGDPAVAGPFLRDVLEGGRDADVGRVIMRDGVTQDW